ncbi:MAG: dienelactone hydrolase family protein [Candidatus Tectomicrobia bacterium]|nr:dienelactone hydrolase family protein [Candidatus Tectomicrobia bacterium]
MILKEDFVDLDTPNGAMRTYTFRPVAQVKYPGIVLFSEIYQVTGPVQRMARTLASQGYIVAVPEIYHEFEPLGAVFPYDKEGTDKGNRYKIEKELSAYDHDARAVLDHLKSLPDCTGKLGSIGICIGGHLSARASMNPDVLAGACFYATDIHERSLGKGMNDNTLERFGELRGEMLMIWGRQDPHVPQEGRELIYKTMKEAEVNFTWHEFNAQHAFMRDEGYRYNAALAQICYAMAFELFARKLHLSEP